MIFIADGLGSVYQDSARFNLLVANHFYCGRQTIGVPGLNSIMKHFFFIVGGRQLLYRDSFLNESYIFYAIHFYCGRMTIGVPGLVLIFWYEDRFIAGDKRLVYRDSTCS